MWESVDEWPAPSESNEPAYSSFSSAPGEENSRYSSYRTGGQWNSDTFLSDSPPGKSDLRPTFYLDREPGPAAADSSETTQDGDTSEDPSSSGNEPGKKLSSAGKKRAPTTPVAGGGKRVKLDFTLENGEQIDVMEVSLRNMKKVAGKPGAKPMWFCMLCLGDLTGQNIELHFRSPDHVKKIIASTTGSESERYPFYCELCRVGCNNQHIYDQHLSGKKHKKFQTASERINALPASPDDAVAELREMLKETVVEEGKASDLGVSEDMKEFFTIKEPLIGLKYAVEIRGLTCDSPIYHCTLCNVHVISGNKSKHFCSNNHRQLVLKKDYPDKWVKLKVNASSSTKKIDQHQLVSEVAAEIEAAEGKKVEEIYRRIVQKPSWNEPVNTNKLDKKAKHGFRGRGRKRGGGGRGRGGAGGSKQSGEPGTSAGEQGASAGGKEEGAAPQKGKRGRQGRGGGGRGQNQKRGGNQGRGRMHPSGSQRGRGGPLRGGPSPRGALWRRGGGRGREHWREGAYHPYEEWPDTGYPREDYGYQDDYYHDSYGLGDPYYAPPPAWDRPPPPSSLFPQSSHTPPPLRTAPYRGSPMDPSPTIQQLFHRVSNSTQSSGVDNMASSLVRTAEDADMALKLSSVLNEALMRYHGAPPQFAKHTTRIAMGFGNLKSDGGLQCLNNFLLDKSYIEGYTPSQGDVAVFDAVGSAPASKFVNALRWYNQIASYSADMRLAFPGVQKPLDQYGPAAAASGGADKEEEEDEDDDDIDLFGSDDEDEEKEREALKKKRVEEYEARKAKKAAVIAKSNIILAVKPWDDETDMVEVERLVREISKDGLVWGASKLVPVAYGIKKLQIACVVEDDKVGTDFLEESITAYEDLVQSVDIVAFNKV